MVVAKTCVECAMVDIKSKGVTIQWSTIDRIRYSMTQMTQQCRLWVATAKAYIIIHSLCHDQNEPYKLAYAVDQYDTGMTWHDRKLWRYKECWPMTSSMVFLLSRSLQQDGTRFLVVNLAFRESDLRADFWSSDFVGALGKAMQDIPWAFYGTEQWGFPSLPWRGRLPFWYLAWPTLHV